MTDSRKITYLLAPFQKVNITFCHSREACPACPAKPCCLERSGERSRGCGNPGFLAVLRQLVSSPRQEHSLYRSRAWSFVKLHKETPYKNGNANFFPKGTRTFSAKSFILPK